MLRIPSIPELVIALPVVLLALTIHECAHGWVACRLGDPTARSQGRLTLNPLVHLDPIGTLALLFSHIGWAKPIPVDLRYLRHPRRDFMLIASAGPASNLLLATACALCLRLVPWNSFGREMLWFVEPLQLMVWMAVTVNVSLFVFNLIPIPPLDGSRLLSYLLPVRHAVVYNRLEPYGFILIMLLIVTGIMDPLFTPAVRTVRLALLQIWG